MGRIGEVIDAKDGEVRVDVGGGNPVTAQHFEDSGVDAPPLPGDYAAIEDAPGKGKKLVTGYHDPKNAGQAQGGEHRSYARDTDGVPVAVIWQKGDGSILIQSVEHGQSVELATDGTIKLGANASDALALASKVNQRVQALENSFDSFVSTYNSHVHPHPNGPTGTTTSTGTPNGNGADTASAVVKSE